MKNKLALYSALLFITGGTVVSTTTALAADSTATTDATVKFIPGDGPTDPNDPDNPDNPNPNPDPDNPGTGNNGPLSLDTVPILKFGEQKISGKEEVYTATNRKPFVQATDNRGTGAGWSVTVEATPFIGDANGTQVELKGAHIDFNNGVIKPGKGNTAEPADAHNVTVSDQAAVIMSAKVGKGQGTWLDVFNNTDTTLTVPGGVAQDQVEYKSTMNWVLNETPGN